MKADRAKEGSELGETLAYLQRLGNEEEPLLALRGKRGRIGREGGRGKISNAS